MSPCRLFHIKGIQGSGGCFPPTRPPQHLDQSNVPTVRYSTSFCSVLSMKSLFFLVGLLPLLSLAAATCECPLVKCGGTEAEVRSIPLLSLSSQISPRTRSHHSGSMNLPMLTSTSPVQICKCVNNAAISCYQKCGGPYPVLQVRQHLSFSTFNHRPILCPKLTTSSPWSGLFHPPNLR